MPDDYLESGELRCPTCMGPVGDDSRRCERPAEPLHRTHLVGGIYHLPINADEQVLVAEAWVLGRKSGDSSTGGG